MPLGLYISVPFCRSKCSYCNFASGVFAREKMQRYVDQLQLDIAEAEELAAANGGSFERAVDSVYFGGGTPTLLAPEQLKSIFAALRANFSIAPEAEITMECAPGTLADETLECLLESGMNRVSLGVQSFVDEEARAVGRLHTAAVTRNDLARLQQRGLRNINVDLIAGLPHQTAESWRHSLEAAIAVEVEHVSLYMLEVDEDSRLGRELLAGGTRYHAHFVPDDALTAELYSTGCERLAAAGLPQYEISNFARTGKESRHNLKYWTRQPYLGFGVDAHSMLEATAGAEMDAVRLAMPEELEDFTGRSALGRWQNVQRTPVSRDEAWEETFFLGLRMNSGVDLAREEKRFGADAGNRALAIAKELEKLGLAEIVSGRLRLKARGRMLSNEAFEKFIGATQAQRT